LPYQVTLVGFLLFAIQKQPTGLIEAADKVVAGQERQGLKPVIFSIVYGPTKVVP
jgi:hypothetical protein